MNTLFIYKGTINKKDTYKGVDENEQAISWPNIEITNRFKPYCLKGFVNNSSHDGVLHLININ